jgi:hypothetical protein
MEADVVVSSSSDLLEHRAYMGIPILTPRKPPEQVELAPEEQPRPRVFLSPVVFQDERPSEMLVAEVTTTDLRKTPCRVDSKDHISKTRQQNPTGVQDRNGRWGAACFSEEDVEPISVVEE